MYSRALAAALIGCTLASVGDGRAAGITVHPADGEGRVFVDVTGDIEDDDFTKFKEKMAQFYRSGRTNSHVIVTLISLGGRAGAATQIGGWVRSYGMATYVPGSRTCTSACALIWVAGATRFVGETPRIGFHATYDPKTGRESGVGNALVGAYLRDLGLPYDAIAFMTSKGPQTVDWLTPDLAQKLGVSYALLRPARAIPLPPNPKGAPPPDQVIASWSDWARSAPAVVTPAAPAPSSGQPVLQVPSIAQRARLYEEDPADTNGKLYVGSATWNAVSAPPGPGGAPELAAQSEIEIPGRLKMAVLIRRNTDKAIPAAYAVEVVFALPNDSPIGGILNVPGVLMKEAEGTRGTPLNGVAVKMSGVFYLLGLSADESHKARNLQLLKTRGWMDIPIVYSSGRRAIVAIEKGGAGQILDDVFAAWEKSESARASGPSQDAEKLKRATRRMN